jgi:hypothetical protein
MAWKCGNIDWIAVEAVGSWAGAVATAGAVYVAASLAGRIAAKERNLVAYQHATMAVLIYDEVTTVVGAAAVLNGPIPISALMDLEEMLSAVNPIEMRTVGIVKDLLLVRRTVAELRDGFVEAGRDLSKIAAVRRMCERALPKLSDATVNLMRTGSGLAKLAGRVRRLASDPRWWEFWKPDPFAANKKAYQGAQRATPPER